MSLGPGGKLLLVLAGVAVIALTLVHYGFLPQLEPLLGRFARPRHEVAAQPLSLADFPAGAATPAAGLTPLPNRPLRVAVPLRGGSASLLWLAGGVGHHADSPSAKGYLLELELATYPSAEAVSDALSGNAADAALVPAEDLGMRWSAYRDAGPRAVALVARSRGSVALAAAPGVGSIAALRGKKLALPSAGAERYLALYELARAGLGISDVTLEPEVDSTHAAAALRESRADAAVGLTPEIALAAKDRAGTVLVTSSDAPFLLDFVLVVRGELLANHPEAVRRLVRGVLDAGDAVRKDALGAGRLLDQAAPSLGDPVQAIRDEPPATLSENLAFFGVSGEAPVRFNELVESGAQLAPAKADWLDRGELRELSAVRAVSAAPSTPASP